MIKMPRRHYLAYGSSAVVCYKKYINNDEIQKHTCFQQIIINFRRQTALC